MKVGAGVWLLGIIVFVVLLWLTIWVTNKAYSKKWEHDEDSRLKDDSQQKDDNQQKQDNQQ